MALGTLKADDRDKVAVELAGLEGLLHLVLRMEDDCRRLDQPVLGFHGGNLDDGFAEIARQDPNASGLLEGFGRSGEHLFVAAGGGRGQARDSAIIGKLRLHRVRPQTFAPDGAHIFMQIAVIEQFADQEAHAGRRR